MGCGGDQLLYDVPKPSGPGAPKPVSGPNTKPAARRPRYYNPILREISYKAQNPSSMTFRDIVILVFSIYTFVYRGYFTLGEVHNLLLVQPMGAVCPNLSLVGCLWRNLWSLVFHVFVEGWLAQVVPWGIVAALGVFFGEEVLGWVGSVRATAKGR